MMTDIREKDGGQGQQIFIRADEVDSGTSISSPSKQLPLSALRPTSENHNTNINNRPKAPARPTLRRDGSNPPPPPPSQPPPAPPSQMENATDSLSLPQLKQLVGQFPKLEQRAYAFQYKEAEDFEQEVDEWFHYTEPEQEREYLLFSREAFEQRWKTFAQDQLDADDTSWTEVEEAVRQDFLIQLTPDLEEEDPGLRIDALACIFYVLTGTWSITSGLVSTQYLNHQTQTADDDGQKHNSLQLEWMHKGADLVVPLIKTLYQSFVATTKPELAVRTTAAEDEETRESVLDDEEFKELSLCLSIFYLLVESARSRLDTAQACDIRHKLLSLEPSFLVVLVATISRLRWDESYNIPVMHAIQLFWKTILLLFGDFKTHLESIKHILQPRVDPFSAEAANPTLTASPLDYHLFRQEITSKYPAYNPPLPLIPLEVEQKTILPPLPQQSRTDAYPGSGGPSINAAATGSSILHQPVHIATPAPSPPPSPIGPGGKAGKKQNYQTNQNFPFLYPPLDTSSNKIGGKGTTEVQDMIGKRWEGSDIPASIIEAGELFASRMRMTRAMQQLWKQRDLFLKYDRGWRGEEKDKATSEEDPDTVNAEAEPEENEFDSLNDRDLRARMDAVEDFFHQALPNLQSLVIVMMKVMLSNVQDIAVRNGNLQDSGQPSGLNRTKSNSNMAQNQNLPLPPPPPKPSETSLEDLDNIRSREISQKAISGAIFLLLKWFKVSHVLKFEYLGQLLLDSNYVQLTLKYFAHQNLEDLVAFKYDRDDLSFFHYCHLHSDHPPLSPTSPDEHSDASSVDDAVPPPIQRHRRSPTSTSEGHRSSGQMMSQDITDEIQTAHPSVDELGNPLAPLPATPIADFSFRQFQTSIHLLRILQKVTRGKAHRILLLVQFKSSQILRRVLRVPDPMLRLYVLKLFKSQVPYCGRKWRQSNMRVITAIYLHCRPELRDEWLAGMHDSNVEGEVDEAVPLEWALRGLTYWWQKRTYPDVMKLRDKDGKGGEEGGQEIDDDERDFFQHELDLLGWGLAGLGIGEDVEFGEEAPGVNGINGEHWEQSAGSHLEQWQ